MAVEQIRPVEGQRKAAQRKTPELNVDTAITILFGTSRLEGDSFISTLRYARNEGMLEGTSMTAVASVPHQRKAKIPETFCQACTD
jgi:hypothetical protein